MCEVIGIDDDYPEYENVMEFYNWILSLKPKDVRDKGILERFAKHHKESERLIVPLT